MSDIEDKVVAIEATQVGIREATGNNDGVMVERYQATVGLGQGDAWCAAFQMWSLEKAGVKGWPVSGYVPTVWDWCKSHNCTSNIPRVGAWVMFFDAIGPYHIGIVEKLNGDGTFGTIEGNESDMVKRMTRSVAGDNAKFGYWADVLTWDDSGPILPELTKKIKFYCHDGKASLVVDGKEVSLKSVTKNGTKVSATDIGALDFILEYKDYS